MYEQSLLNFVNNLTFQTKDVSQGFLKKNRFVNIIRLAARRKQFLLLVTQFSNYFSQSVAPLAKNRTNNRISFNSDCISLCADFSFLNVLLDLCKNSNFMFLDFLTSAELLLWQCTRS
jgi:hypothetical protein